MKLEYLWKYLSIFSLVFLGYLTVFEVNTSLYFAVCIYFALEKKVSYINVVFFSSLNNFGMFCELHWTELYLVSFLITIEREE